MTYIRVSDLVQLSVQDVGQGSPVVLVAGFGLDHRVWEREVSVLYERHRVICVDQRGHGASDKPADGYDIDRLATDLLTVLERLDVSDCGLVGWSFGGQVAFHATAMDSRRISRLALVGSNAVRASRSAEFPFGRLPDELEGPLVAAEQRDRLAARRATIAAGFHRPPDNQLLDRLVEVSLAMPSYAAVACYRSMLRTDLVADIERVTVPVSQIIGAADPVHSAKGARWLNDRLSDAEFVALQECGHYPMFEAPEEFDDILLRFAAGERRGTHSHAGRAG